jgi:hypothetical protein
LNFNYVKTSFAGKWGWTRAKPMPINTWQQKIASGEALDAFFVGFFQFKRFHEPSREAIDF